MRKVFKRFNVLSSVTGVKGTRDENVAQYSRHTPLCTASGLAGSIFVGFPEGKVLGYSAIQLILFCVSDIY